MTAIRILGIDPGSQITGFGIVELSAGRTAPVRWGSIRTDGDHSARLRSIFVEVARVVREFRPAEIAIERVFLHRNADSALKLGQARAAAICATFDADLPVYEYSARHIKKAVVGPGRRGEGSGATHGADPIGRSRRASCGCRRRVGGGYLSRPRARRAVVVACGGGAVVIGSLKGTLLSKRPPWLTLDVGGVGYELEAPMSTFYRLPEPGKPLSLITHLIVREDAHALYGFSTEAERLLFRNLLKVSQVGARVALGVLSGMSVEGFYQCVRNKDLVSLMKVPGVGRKTAERLLLEMADRLPENTKESASALPAKSGSEGEAQGALLALGYKPGEVMKMLRDLDGARFSTEEMIREALRRVHRAAAE